MEPFMIVHNSGSGMTCARATTLSAAKHLATNWQALVREYDPARSIAIIYLPEDRLLYFRQPNNSFMQFVQAVCQVQEAIAETVRTGCHEALGRIAQLFRTTAR